MSTNIALTCILIANKCFNYINPYLNNYELFSNSINQLIKTKAGNNEQFQFDIELDNIIKGVIENSGLNASVFSEEGGFFNLRTGNDYYIVYDPFCNSSLASKNFREAAMGITFFNNSFDVEVSMLLDYQTGLITLLANNEVKYSQVNSVKQIQINKKLNESLKDSWVVITLENQEERKHLNQANTILSKSKRIFISSGHIYWHKLSTFNIDAYLDPFGGEKLYEMFPAIIIQKLGGKVTNINGDDFNSAKMLKTFLKNPDYIFYPVSATSKKLHKEIIETINPTAR